MHKFNEQYFYQILYQIHDRHYSSGTLVEQVEDYFMERICFDYDEREFIRTSDGHGVGDEFNVWHGYPKYFDSRTGECVFNAADVTFIISSLGEKKPTIQELTAERLKLENDLMKRDLAKEEQMENTISKLRDVISSLKEQIKEQQDKLNNYVPKPRKFGGGPAF